MNGEVSAYLHACMPILTCMCFHAWAYLCRHECRNPLVAHIIFMWTVLKCSFFINETIYTQIRVHLCGRQNNHDFRLT